jgi:UDP-glucose 4-epimerase
MAANSDIQRSAQETDRDLHLTFLTTYNVAECARRSGTREIVFPSSSTVYGALEQPLAEETGPLLPVSLYGAAKLAAEGFLASYASMFDRAVWIVRLPNVVGPRLTHGCIHDFMRRLRDDPTRLVVLGDGRQRKPYAHVDDVIDALLLVRERARERVSLFNLAAEGNTSVREIAAIVIEEMGLRDVAIEFTGGESGWPGDVARFEYDTRRIERLGWKARHDSTEAVRLAVRAEVERMNRSREGAS